MTRGRISIHPLGTTCIVVRTRGTLRLAPFRTGCVLWPSGTARPTGPFLFRSCPVKFLPIGSGFPNRDCSYSRLRVPFWNSVPAIPGSADDEIRATLIARACGTELLLVRPGSPVFRVRLVWRPCSSHGRQDSNANCAITNGAGRPRVKLGVDAFPRALRNTAGSKAGSMREDDHRRPQKFSLDRNGNQTGLSASCDFIEPSGLAKNAVKSAWFGISDACRARREGQLAGRRRGSKSITGPER